MKFFKNLIYLVLVVFPTISFAAPLNGVKEILTEFRGLIKLVMPMVFALAVLFFFWGIAKFILKAGDSKAKEEGRNIMIWGVIALFVLVSFWGIIGFIQKQLGIDGANNSATGGSLNNNGLGNI